MLRLYDESLEVFKGNSDNAIKSVLEQLPFFCNQAILIDESYQKDIEKYLYCNETSTPAYSGTYNDTPKLWVDKYYVIKRALAVRQQVLKEQVKDNRNDK